jgi:hypothetical protein
LKRRLLLAAPTIVALTLVGCGSEPAPSRQAAVDLSITASDGHGKTQRARLRCDGGEQRASGFGAASVGDLCRIAEHLERFLSSEPDPRRACTQIYGGPQTARVSGRIKGSDVDRRLSRTDGCRISDWERAAPLIPLNPL